MFIVAPLEKRIVHIEEKSGKLFYKKQKNDKDQETNENNIIEINHPTFENIYYDVTFAPDIFLFHLFPNTFKDIKEVVGQALPDLPANNSRNRANGENSQVSINSVLNFYL